MIQFIVPTPVSKHFIQFSKETSKYNVQCQRIVKVFMPETEYEIQIQCI
jgi:hypothetical protein